MSTRTPDLTALGLPERALRSYRGDGLTNAGRFAAWLVAVLLVLAGSAVLAAAGVMPTFGDRPGAQRAAHGSSAGSGAGGADARSTDPAGRSGTTNGNGAVHAEWDGPTTHLAWHGGQYATAESDFIGTRVASPGDRVQRTLRIRNDGAGDATMTVDLQLGKRTEDTTVNTRLDDAVELFWDVSGVRGTQTYATLLRDGQPSVAEVRVPHGKTVTVLVGFDMPAGITGHRNAGAPSTVLDFRVVATMQGETHVTPPMLAWTGQDLALVLAVAAIALGLVLLGLLLAALGRRRRRCDDCEEPIRATDEYTLHHTAHGRSIRRCADCTAVGADWATP